MLDKRGFSAAGRTDYTHKRTFFDFKVHVIQRLLLVGLEPLLGNDPALFRRDLAECLVDDAVELGPVLADAEGVPVRRVDGTGGAEVADAAVVDFSVMLNW